MNRPLRLALGTTVLLLAAGMRLWALASLPPGLHHDEAFHLLSARGIVEGQGVPVYITGNQGNEPMYAYLNTVGLWVLGEANWAGRLVAAWVGLVSVALTIRLGHGLYPRRLVGVFAGLALAGLYWHLTMSRWGSQPILSAAAAAGSLAGLWHGARSGRMRSFALAGTSLSFGLWAYMAFRVFPLVPLAGGLALLAAQRWPTRRLVIGGVLAAATALVVYTPLGLFFLRQPEWFFHRYSQITELQPSAQATLSDRLVTNAARVAASLVWPGQGDENWRQNLPGRPAFDPIQASLAGLGLWTATRRWRSPETQLLAAWLVVGLAPSVVTEFPPQFGRTVMVTPALAMLVGLGAETLWVSRRPWLARLAAVALLGSTALTARDYFVRWAGDEHLFIAFDTGLYDLAGHLRERPAGTALYETPVYRDYPTLEFTLGLEAYQRFRAFNGRACTVLPTATGAPVTYAIIVAEGQLSLPALQAAYPAGTTTLLHDFAGRDYAVLFDLPARQAPRTPAGAQAEFGGILRLHIYQWDAARLAAGESLAITLIWEMAVATRAQLSNYVHVLGPPQANGNTVYAQRDSEPCDNAYPTWQWQPGEVLVDYLSVPLPETMPAGEYTLTVGWYDALTQQRLPVTAGAETGGSHPLGTLTVEIP